MVIGASGALLSGPIVGLVAEVWSTRAGFAIVALAGGVIVTLADRLLTRPAPVVVDVTERDVALDVVAAAG
jgi:hypothetical protein